MEQHLEAGAWPRHRHWGAYAAIVVAGGYFEAGGDGRWRVVAGDIIAHRPFDAHQNRIDGPARVLNLPLPLLTDLPPVFRVADFEALVRACGRDPVEASTLLMPVQQQATVVDDWPDLLAAALRSDPDLRVGDWAGANGLAAATVSRGFARTFGVSPARYRAEGRARIAWRRLMTEALPLGALAHDCGYADQAHMARAILALTGRTPGTWRQVKSVQERKPRLN